MLGRVIIGNTNIFKLQCFSFRIISPFTLPWPSNEVWQKCVFTRAVILCLVFGEFLWEMAHFTNAFGQEENLIVGTRVRGESTKIGPLFRQSLAKNAEVTRGALLTLDNKQSSAAF